MANINFYTLDTDGALNGTNALVSAKLENIPRQNDLIRLCLDDKMGLYRVKEVIHYYNYGNDNNDIIVLGDIDIHVFSEDIPDI
ncbi:hypothetical protein RRK63_000951 [Vibrio fluvialis]|nr:hypothetical protein [Vibrio fluvialis]